LAPSAGHPSWAQKHGGILKLYSPGSPASMSPLEEATMVAEMPMMAVFNNLGRRRLRHLQLSARSQ
jgi:hypothetical protein